MLVTIIVVISCSHLSQELFLEHYVCLIRSPDEAQFGISSHAPAAS